MNDFIRRWIMEELSPVNPESGFALCPYAKKAWLENKVDIQLRDPDSGYISQLHKLVKSIDFEKKEILIFCDLFFKEYSLNRYLINYIYR